jgi:hypothetical protein
MEQVDAVSDLNKGIYWIATFPLGEIDDVDCQ